MLEVYWSYDPGESVRLAVRGPGFEVPSEG